MFPADATDQRRQLNWVLAWAVVFCDIGPLVYYVPASFMVTLKTPRRFLCFFSSISKFRGAIPEVEAWLPSRPTHLDPCGLLGWHAHHCGLLPHHGYFGSRSQNTQSRSSSCSRKTSRNNPDLDRVTQRCRNHRPCGQGARCRPPF